MTDWTFNETDARLAEELQRRLPERMFDAHAHLYRIDDLQRLPAGSMFHQGPAEATPAVWREFVGKQVGATRLQGALFLATPFTAPDQTAPHNAFLAAALEALPESRWLAAISPAMTPAQCEAFLTSPQFAGFKPYHLYSTSTPTFQSPLNAYLPEWAWEMADAHGLVITLHMVRTGALSDPDNQREITAMCRKYPRAKLILAHAARGFHGPNTVKGLPALADLQNVWFDASGVCESLAFAAILRAFGPTRLLWGSDFPVSEIRGKCVTIGDGFHWLQAPSMAWDNAAFCKPALVGLESLRALFEAIDATNLNEDDVQNICADNARRLLGVLPAEARNQELYRYAKTRIPGGVGLLSKRPEMFAPEQWPPYFRETRGCETWDIDGRHYYDMSLNAVGACLLGYADPDVTRAVCRRVELGNICSLNPPEDVELADVLCEMHPWAEQVRLARTGGETCAVAVRIARATTDRSLVAICGYHGCHDWYLAANLGESDALRGHLLPGLDPLGVPREMRGTACTFTYNNRAEFLAILDQYGDQLAAVIMEPCRNNDPEPGFLEFVRDGAHRAGALFMFDEVTIGFRLARGGGHLRFGVNPDIAVFAKSLGNGHPMGAIIGTRAAMAGAHSSFISSSYWTDGVGPSAALATLKKMRAIDVPAHVAEVGTRVMEFWRCHAATHGLPVVVDECYPCLAHFHFDHPQKDELRTLLAQLMLQRGYLAGLAIYPTLAHTEPIVTRFGEVIDEVFAELAAILQTGDLAAHLQGPVAHTGFRRLL